MTTNLSQAHDQWRTRPADQRFKTIDRMAERLKQYKAASFEAESPLKELELSVQNGELQIQGKSRKLAYLSHNGFNRLSRELKAPPEYLRTLPEAVVAQNLNYGLKSVNEDTTKKLLLFKQDNDFYVRAITSERYSRIWNYDLAAQIYRYEHAGWRVPPARPAGVEGEETWIATEEDCMEGSYVKPGELVAPAGLYASEKDMFVFLINPNHEVDGLFRGVMLWNSEVGDRTLGGMSFLFNGVCGNHIVWGAKEIVSFSKRHIGDMNACWDKIENGLKGSLEESALETHQEIKKAKTTMLGSSKEEVATLLYNKRLGSLNTFNAAVDEAYNHPEDLGGASPLSIWGVVQGITRYSQKSPYMDERLKLDTMAGAVGRMVF
jgi:hypothetical protein